MSASSKINVPILAAGLVLTAAVVGLLAVGFRYDPRRLDPTVMHQQPAPPFALQTVDGQVVRLEALRGRPVVINFWSTWCIPCKQEHPVLLQAARRYPQVTFLGIVYQDTKLKVSNYLRRYGQGYQHLLDPSSRTAIDYGVTGVPETFFIAPDGTIAHKTNGVVVPQLIVEQLEPMLRGAL